MGNLAGRLCKVALFTTTTLPVMTSSVNACPIAQLRSSPRQRRNTLPNSTPEYDYDRAAACVVRCEKELSDCINLGTATGTETCDLHYHDCAEECDRCPETEEC